MFIQPKLESNYYTRVINIGGNALPTIHASVLRCS